MDESLRRRLTELGRLSVEGRFGEEIRKAAEEYKDLPSDMRLFVRVVRDFYKPRSTEEDAQIAWAADLFCKLIIVVYRDAKKRDVDVANALAFSFLKDYPGVPNTSLFSKWDDLSKASLGLKAAAHTELVLVWEQAKNLVRAYNEFLGGLLGFLIIGWRCALGKTFSPNFLGNAYGAKVNEFAQLTSGDDGAFYLIFRLARPDLRNAIAHGTIWLDTESNKAKFTDRGQEHEIDLVDFLGLAAVGSHLGHAYLTAIAAIRVLEDGGATNVTQLPPELPQLFNHR